jgi:NAD(P)H-dependent FMN reductase
MATQTAAQDKLRIAIIIGSNRPNRFGGKVSSWFIGEARKNEEIEIDVIDLIDVKVPIDHAGGPDADAFKQRIGDADGFIVITPEYNHSFPGYLKIAIDSASAEWKTKAVGFVAYGGVSGGLRAVEGLRLVFAELHAVTIRDAVSLHSPWALFTEDGSVESPEAINATAAYVLNELVWWARSLKAGREAVPYPG